MILFDKDYFTEYKSNKEFLNDILKHKTCPILINKDRWYFTTVKCSTYCFLCKKIREKEKGPIYIQTIVDFVSKNYDRLYGLKQLDLFTGE